MLETESEEESRLLLDEQTKELFQNNDTVVTSRKTPSGGGLNLAVRRAKPNQGGTALVGPKSQQQIAMKPRRNKLIAVENHLQKGILKIVPQWAYNSRTAIHQTISHVCADRSKYHS